MDAAAVRTSPQTPSAGLPRSIVTQDYLKAIYAAGEWEASAMSVSALATRMEVSASTASETVRRLAAEGLVHHERYGAITLTELGRQMALRVIRRHRLVETFLVELLGYDWHEVHDEAEVLEHAVSDQLVERIDVVLGRPGRDPHGDPIPGPDGQLPSLDAVLLTDLAEGDSGLVVRIADTEPEVLKFLATHDIGLDARIGVVERRAFAGTTVFEVSPPGHQEVRVVELGEPAAAAIWVTPER